VAPQPLDVGDQVDRRIVPELTQRRRAPCASLIEDHDAVMRGVEKTTVCRGGACPWPAMQKKHRHAMRIARLLPVHRMHGIELQSAGAVGLYLRIERSARWL